MRKRLLKRAAAVLIPMFLVGSAYLAVQTWERGALPWNRPPIVDVDWFDLNVEHRGVRTEGAVHLNAGFKLIYRDGGCSGGEKTEQAYLYPLFEPENYRIDDQEVRILLYTTQPPEDDLVDFETRIIEGFLRPLGPDRWDPTVKTNLEERGYLVPAEFEANVLVIDEFVD